MAIAALLLLVPGIAVSYYLIGRTAARRHRRWMDALGTLAEVTTQAGHRYEVADGDRTIRHDPEPGTNCRVIPHEAAIRIPLQVRPKAACPPERHVILRA